MPCKTLKNDSPRPRIRIPRKTTYPSYLYRRGQFFYFRYILPERYRKQGKTELRLSLQTPYLRVAKELAQRLRQALNQMIGMLMDYETLRLRLNGLLRAILEQDTRDFSERPSVTIPGIGTISYGEYYNRCSNIDYFNLQTEKGLLAAAQNVIPMLLRQGLIRQEDIRTPQHILLITKEYLRMEITRNRILKCREDGDFMTERGAFAENYIPFPPSQNDFSVPASQPQSIEPRYPVKGEWINTESHTFRVIPQNRRVTLDRKRLAEELNTLLGEQNAQTLMAKCEKQGEPFERLHAVEV